MTMRTLTHQSAAEHCVPVLPREGSQLSSCLRHRAARAKACDCIHDDNMQMLVIKKPSSAVASIPGHFRGTEAEDWPREKAPPVALEPSDVQQWR